MEVKLDKKLHRYLVQNSLNLKIDTVVNGRYTVLTPNPYSLKDADLISSDEEVNKELQRMKHIPMVVSTLLGSLAAKDFRKLLKKKGYAFFYVYNRAVRVTINPLERVI